MQTAHSAKSYPKTTFDFKLIFSLSAFLLLVLNTNLVVPFNYSRSIKLLPDTPQPKVLSSQVLQAQVAGSLNFLYDGGGQRIYKGVNGGEHTYYISPGIEVEISPQGSVTYRKNYYFSGKLVAVKDNLTGSEQVNYLHQDHLGSTSLVTSNTGQVVSQQVYFPYGSTRTTNGTLPTERAYTGQISDTDLTGLYYYNARYYNPQIAKFTQADSQGDTLNKYTYVGNNPIIFTDPSGNMLDAGDGGGVANSRRRTRGPLSRPTRGGARTLTTCVNCHERMVPLRDSYTGVTDIISHSPNLQDALEYLDSGFANQLTVSPITLSNKKFDVRATLLHLLCGSFCYNYITNRIYMEEGDFVLDSLAEINTVIQQVVPEYELNEDLAFLHEARHFWQYNYDVDSSFIEGIAREAVRTGLLLDAVLEEDYKLNIEEGAVLPIRPHTIVSANEVYWDNPNEIDAIIAETMLNRSTSQEFKTNYPRIWNFMLSKPGYFNNDIYKQFLYNFMYKQNRIRKIK